MIRFAHSEYLYLLGLIPVFILLFVLIARARKKALSHFGSVDILSSLAESASAPKRAVKFMVFLFAYAVVVVGLANPQIGTRLQEVKQEGVDLFIALDEAFVNAVKHGNKFDSAKFVRITADVSPDVS